MGACTIPVTDGSPLVNVPVLSNTIVCSLLAFSIASAPLNNTPYSAALPVPAIIALGVANPTAHGQEITKTVTDKSREKPKTPISPNAKGERINRLPASKKRLYPAKNQKRNTRTANK